MPRKAATTREQWEALAHLTQNQAAKELGVPYHRATWAKKKWGITFRNERFSPKGQCGEHNPLRLLTPEERNFFHRHRDQGHSWNECLRRVGRDDLIFSELGETG